VLLHHLIAARRGDADLYRREVELDLLIEGVGINGIDTGDNGIGRLAATRCHRLADSPSPTSPPLARVLMILLPVDRGSPEPRRCFGIVSGTRTA
jgi:hypothetical protein